MIRLSKKCIILIVFIVPFVTSDVLDVERSSFFGFTHEVSFSTTTMELVQALSEAVMQQSAGDRPVRRYFQRMGNYITHLWWGGDPDKSDEFSGLTLRDVYHIQSTWGPIYAQSGTYGMLMFLRLFNKNPNTKAFFKAIKNKTDQQITSSYQFKAHVSTLMGSINSAVQNLMEPEVTAALMNKLGETHHAKHVEKIHFEEFREIWIEVLEKDLKVYETVLASWIKFIEFIYKHIFERLNGDDR